MQKVSDKIEGRIYPLLISEGRSEGSRKQFTQAESGSVISTCDSETTPVVTPTSRKQKKNKI